MNYYLKWKEMVEESTRDEKKQYEFWNDFCDEEKGIYKSILKEKSPIIKGSFQELAEKYNVSKEYFMGFLDGINDSLVNSLQIKDIEDSTLIEAEINFEELYKNMLSVPAEWLYTLEEWSSILSIEDRKRIKKGYNRSKIVVNDSKVGRNDPCPCGSGKKYKKCCGLPG